MTNRIYMTSPINAIIEGLYEARTTMAQLKEKGDFGIGTFNDLDGELVLIDGQVYQLDVAGEAHDVMDEVCTPFASVCFFQGHARDHIGPADHAGFNRLIEANMPSPNMFYAFRVDAEFGFVRTRSVPRTENHTPLVEAVSRQQERRFSDISGSLVGFYCPSFIPSVNVPGLHFHFITDDRRAGGHLLECEIRRGRLSVQFFHEIILALPVTLDYLTADFTRDSARDLEKAER